MRGATYAALANALAGPPARKVVGDPEARELVLLWRGIEALREGCAPA